MKKLVLFGAGVYAKKYLSLLEYLQMTFDYFSDNDKNTHGNKLFGKEIIDPNKLIDLDCQIIISCTHTEAIKKQLQEMGILHKLIDIGDIYRDYIKTLEVNNHSNETKYSLSSHNKKDTNILIDMYEGIGWGGTEIWAAEVADGFSKKGYQVILGGSDLQTPLGEKYEKYVTRFTSLNTIQQMCKMIEENLPCVVINNFSGCIFLAASLMKIKYPNDIRIISVIHNDNKGLFDAHMMLRKSIDSIMCVSERIRQRMIKEYSWEEDKIYFKEQPIAYEENFEKLYWRFDCPIKIGYAGRIVKQQKRADCIPKLIEILEREQMNYLLNIAGEGECIELIRSFVEKNGLEKKVKLLGRLEKEHMADFWKEQDIFINLSEYEGTSLAMLEAMSYGCIPVVTDVSGVREFVQNDINGYICSVGKLEEIVEAIQRVMKNESNIKSFSEKCSLEIKKRCNREEYINYIENIVYRVWS